MTGDGGSGLLLLGHVALGLAMLVIWTIAFPPFAIGRKRVRRDDDVPRTPPKAPGTPWNRW